MVLKLAVARMPQRAGELTDDCAPTPVADSVVFCVGPKQFAFLTHSQVLSMLPVQGPHSENAWTISQEVNQVNPCDQEQMTPIL